MAAKHFGEFELIDYSEKRSSTRFFFGAITALNLAGFLTQFGNLRTAIDNITLGTISRERWIGDSDMLSNIPPSNHRAQVEMKWFVFLQNLTDKNYFQITVPCPDFDLTEPGSDLADFANTDIAAFITALETIIVDPVYGRNDCSVWEMYIGGKNY